MYNSSRMEYWSTALKFIGFFVIGYIIHKTGMVSSPSSPPAED